MQPADIGIGASLPRPTPGGVGDIGSDNPLEGIEHLAGVTGGARLPLDATGTGSLLRVAKESSAYYVAELEPVRGEVFGRSRPLGVRVARRGVTVRARPEITFTDTARARTTRLTVSDILASTEAATDLRLRVGGFTVRDRGRQAASGRPGGAGRRLGWARVGRRHPDRGQRPRGRALERQGCDRTSAPRRDDRPARLLPRARRRHRYHRAPGRSGSGDRRRPHRGRRALARFAAAQRLARRDAPFCSWSSASEPTARASFDIYGGTAGQRLSATLEVSRDLDGPAIATVPLALTRADDTRVVATGNRAARRAGARRLRRARHHPPRGRDDRACGEDAEESREVGQRGEPRGVAAEGSRGAGYATATRLSSSRLLSK